MLSLPSSRKLGYPALILLAVLTLLKFFMVISQNAYTIAFGHLSPSESSFSFSLDVHANLDLSLNDLFITQHHASNPLPTSNLYVAHYLSRCQKAPNADTNYIRLPSIQILNISMVPSSDSTSESESEFLSNRYFNPATIPLPSHLSSAPYLLISRLVTDGSHQQSHICFADICSPDHSSKVAGVTRLCTISDLKLLGANGGMRCVSKPEKVNIPPTPARRCSGTWRHLPDIPGFHDPRVFWSGKGEPLIEVNSGSKYGCVGLWLVDLRAIFPPFADILKRKKIEVRSNGLNDKKETRQQHTMDLIAIGPEMGYSYLTEITRNPRESRSEVEKNWVPFFPNEDEAWVQYDMMGQVVRIDPSERQVVVISTNDIKASVGTGQASNAMVYANAAVNKPAPSLHEPSLDKRDQQFDGIPAAQSSWNLSSTYTNSTVNTNVAPQPTPVESSQASITIKGGRTIAKLLSHGYTSPNLTSPSEPSCFDLSDRSITHDSLNNTGHWHQGSNSLRLILCTREQFRSRTCHLQKISLNDTEDRSRTTRDEYERLLIKQGAVIHFSVVHRKFSNTWELPMRYERYFMAWEARAPFRVVAVSQYPLLFGMEQARPWPIEEDMGLGLGLVEFRKGIPDDAGETQQKHERKERRGDKGIVQSPGQMFTYTPSIAWAWRAKDEDEEFHRGRGHEDLGTGYLNNEIIVGIGIDDLGQGFVKVKVENVLGCLRLCPSGGSN